MRDPQVVSWVREPHVSAGMLASVRELNHRFLRLPEAQARFPAATSMARLSEAQTAAAAACPYALFDLCFTDGHHWQSRLRAASPWAVADAAPVDAETLDFVRVALFFAWHVASTNQICGRLLLGMHEDTAAAFGDARIDCLPAVAMSEAHNLTARWIDCAPYWKSLAAAAALPGTANLRRIQLYGIQLTAAARLT